MKKIFVSAILLLLFVAAPVSATPITPYLGVRINFTFSKIDKGNGISGPHRTPAREPEIFIDGNTLYFEDSCDGCTLQLLLPDSDVVVYSTVIPSGTTVLTLPYEGEYDLQIVCGDYYFVGSITVE